MRKFLLNRLDGKSARALLAVLAVIYFRQRGGKRNRSSHVGTLEPNTSELIHLQMFADEVTKRSNGRLKIEYYPSKQLFGIREILGAITSGAVELGGVVGVVSFPPINKNFNVASYPGLFSSYEQQRGFFLKSEKGQQIWSDITKKSNSQLIMYNPVGPVMTFSSARELTSIDVMKGLKARRLLKSELPMWKALEAMPSLSNWRSLHISANWYDRHDQ